MFKRRKQSLICIKKRPFTSRWHAEEAARKVSHKIAIIDVYECPVCGSWHLTKQLQKDSVSV